jgi:hypothetical protein
MVEQRVFAKETRLELEEKMGGNSPAQDWRCTGEKSLICHHENRSV